MNEKWAPDLTKSITSQTSQQARRYRQEKQFAQQHACDSDQMLLAYIASLANALGHEPSKQETIGYIYLKERLGSWPTILVKAGLKEPRQHRTNRNRTRDAENQARRNQDKQQKKEAYRNGGNKEKL